MVIVKILLFPFACIYGILTGLRNRLFDWRILPSCSFNIPVISIGNLSAGGTGKTPHTEYLTELLRKKYKVAILSRGYRRKTKGFIMASAEHSQRDIGDEPMQYLKKFEDVVIAVDEDRKRGILRILEGKPETEVILLDDAFQHRAVKIHLDVVLIDENRFLGNRLLLPSGILRDKISRLRSSDVIILSKVKDINSVSVKEKLSYLKKFGKKILLSKLDYSYVSDGTSKTALKDISGLNISLFCGIGNPDDFFSIFNNFRIVYSKAFSDHCSYTESEMAVLKKLKNNSDILITTYKDFVKIPPAIVIELNIRYLEIDLKFYDSSRAEYDISDLIMR